MRDFSYSYIREHGIMKCEKCGNTVKSGQKFCSSCGAPISEMSDTVVQENGKKTKNKITKKKIILIIVILALIGGIQEQFNGNSGKKETQMLEGTWSAGGESSGDAERAAENEASDSIGEYTDACVHLNDANTFINKSRDSYPLTGESFSQVIENYMDNVVWTAWDSEAYYEYYVEAAGTVYYDSSIQMEIVYCVNTKFDKFSFYIVYDGEEYTYNWGHGFFMEKLLDGTEINVDDWFDWAAKSE